MPEMNGFEFVKKIQDAGFNIPVYALTARSDIQAEELSQFGFSGCLHKPFTAEELISTVKNLAPQKNTKKNFNFSSLTAFAGTDEEAATEYHTDPSSLKPGKTVKRLPRHYKTEMYNL
jgi:DNA-binding response OmpR family regulator